MTVGFFIESLMLAFGVAVDAFVVSTANGISERNINAKDILKIAGLFGLFQAVMPLIGYFFGSLMLDKIYSVLPYISLFILCYLGINTIFGGKDDNIKNSTLSFKVLLVQAVATSLDALCVGFTILEQSRLSAIICVCIIGIVTFLLCSIGVIIGKKFGNKYNKIASIISGSMLIIIGVEIFLKYFISIF